MARRPLIWFTVCWVLGSSAAAGLTNPGTYLAGVAVFVMLLTLTLMKQASWQLAAACLAAFTLAAGQRMWEDARNVTGLPAELVAAQVAVPMGAITYPAKITGVLTEPPEVDGDLVQMVVKVDTVKLARESQPQALRGERMQLQVRLAEESELAVAANWRRGQRITAVGELAAPAAATNFGGFDYRRYLNSQRIHWLFSADGAAALTTSAGPRYSAAALLGGMDAAREALGKRMDALYPGIQAGYMKGLVIGITDDLDPTVYRQFAQLGLTHILAISGLHVAVFLYVLGGLLRLLRMTRERMLLLLIAAVPLYVLLAGGSPSVVRSGIMAMLGLAAARMHKLKDGLHLLAAAALAMLVWDPYMLGNVGFQLSFLVTAGLILGVTPIRRCLPRGKHKWQASLLDLLAVTLVAQAVSLPLTLYYFNQQHLLSLLANLILVPFISFIIMPLGGASMLLDSMWHPIGVLSAHVTAMGNELTFAFVAKLSSWNSFRLIWATPPLWWVITCYVALMVVFSALNRIFWGRSDEVRGEDDTQPLQASQTTPFIQLDGIGSRFSKRLNRLQLLLSSLTLVVLLIWAYNPDALNHRGYVQFIDVGQGDSILIRSAAGKHILIDGGGTVQFGNREAWRQRMDPYEVGQKLLLPLLQQRGVHHIDLLVLSHLDSDHIKGLQAILTSIPVKAILWNGTWKGSEDAITLLRTALNKEIPLYPAHAGLEWTIDKHTRISILHTPTSASAPQASTIPEEEEQNGHSVALCLRLYDRQFLFTGDADIAEEQQIITELQQHALASSTNSSPIDVMKISHHGSKTSTSEQWISYWQPHTAVISVGRNNIYGHPANNVINRLDAAGIPVKRTDWGGEIQFRVNPDGMITAKQKIPVHNS
ncbi:DNA internalization-related competence protein ComEC/Rec2 [Paenibacillus sp. OV219]|uniref:DNA internalization-related competence protein ComEC/Rec2 n=1 Tax=Paenibacillus sp. OV219 TaxID=1884377 RepID=UPI0008ADED73|nr:DNA internalization-related competence protein ComEC/Rec2 [Paenibacillus sp. OV219]SEN07545.1 competence protein ComEC [Paenibacillus sp. OV219]